MSATFPSNESFLKLLPAVGPLTPQPFVAIVFPFKSLPVADPVGVTMNSMPTMFELTMLSLRTFPVAMTLKRMPARLLAETVLSFNVLSTPPNTRMPTRFPVKVLFLMSLSDEPVLSMIPAGCAVSERVLLDCVPDTPVLQVDAFGILHELGVLDHDIGRGVDAHGHREIPDCAAGDRDVGSADHGNTNAAAGPGDRVTIQVDPDAVGTHDEAVAGADQIVIQLQVVGDRRAAQVVCRSLGTPTSAPSVTASDKTSLVPKTLAMSASIA